MRVLLLAGAVVLAGCERDSDSPTGVNCPDVAIPAISVATLNLFTGQPITGIAEVVVRDGAYADTAHGIGSPPRYAAAYNRAGTYTISVQAPGYRAWEYTGAVVRPGICNVTTLPLAAWMLPSL